MGFQSILKIGTQAFSQARKIYVKPMCEIRTMESLGLKMEQLTGDITQFRMLEKIIERTETVTKSITRKPVVMLKEEAENLDEVKKVMMDLRTEGFNPSKSKIELQLSNSAFQNATIEIKQDGGQVVTYLDKYSESGPIKMIRKTYDKTGKEAHVLIIRPNSTIFSNPHGIDLEIIESHNGMPLQYIGIVENTANGKRVERNFTSLLGTKTEYRVEPLENGRKVIYKITDKSGKILMDEHRIFEKLDDNHSRTVLKDFIYETEYNKENIIIRKLDKEGNLLDSKLLDIGGEDYNPNFWGTWWKVPEEIVGNHKLDKNLIGLYKDIQGDALYKIAELNTKIRYGNPIQQRDVFIDYLNTIFLSQKEESPFIVLHELGHAIDYNMAEYLSKNSKLCEALKKCREIYENKTSAKNFPFMTYILTGREAPAETYALLSGQMNDNPLIALRSTLFQMEFADYIALLQKSL